MGANHTPGTEDNRSVGSPRPREISDFLAAVRHRSQNPIGDGGDNADLLAWKSSLLERIADNSDDPEVHDVAANARAQLDHARNDDPGTGGDQ